MRGLQTATWLGSRSLGFPPQFGFWVSLKDVGEQPVTGMQWHWVRLSLYPDLFGGQSRMRCSDYACEVVNKNTQQGTTICLKCVLLCS